MIEDKICSAQYEMNDIYSFQFRRKNHRITYNFNLLMTFPLSLIPAFL